MNDFPQRIHVNGFTPECILSWSLRLPARAYDIPQRVHVKGLSPECIRSCSRKYPTRANDFPQVEQAKCFTLVSILSGTFLSH